jgi:chemotaxis protein CheX
MDVNSVNPILEAFVQVLPQIGFATIEKKSVALEGAVIQNSGIIINIGVMGPLKGVILIGMDLDSARQFASKMMMGMEVHELDVLAQSAVSEMGNMVCAHACIKFSEAGVNGLDISPPTLLIGEGGQVRVSVPKIIVVKFAVDGIPVNVYVGLFS